MYLNLDDPVCTECIDQLWIDSVTTIMHGLSITEIVIEVDMRAPRLQVISFIQVLSSETDYDLIFDPCLRIAVIVGTAMFPILVYCFFIDLTKEFLFTCVQSETDNDSMKTARKI